MPSEQAPDLTKNDIEPDIFDKILSKINAKEL